MQELENLIQTMKKKKMGDSKASETLLKHLKQMPASEETAPLEEIDPLAEKNMMPVLDQEFDINYNVEVQNNLKTWKFDRTFIYIRPKSLRGTVNAIRLAESLGKKVRGLGSRHSYSKLVETTDCYIDMKKAHPYLLAKHNSTVKKLDQSPLEILKPNEDKNYLLNVPAGLTIHQLNHILYPDNKNHIRRFGKKRLFNMGGGDVQQYVGAFSTGTHGSGGRFSTYHDTIRSILLVTSEGKIYRIEPKKGITDPEKHKEKYKNAHQIDQVTLIQNDNKFHAALVNMGCFGIIYSVVIEITDMTLLHEENFYHKAGFNKKFRKKINANLLPADPKNEFFYYLLLNPYKLKRKGNFSVAEKIVTTTNKPGKTKNERNKNFWPSFLSTLDLTRDVTQWLLNSAKVPIRWAIETALSAQKDNKETQGKGYTDICYKVWNAGLGKLDTIGSAIEFAFPVDEINDVVDYLFAFLEQESKKKRGYYFNSPVALRFVRPSEALLAPNYKEYKGKNVKLWCYIEVLRVSSNDPEQQKMELELYQHTQMLLFLKGGRPHWGLNFDFPFSQQNLKQLYPKFKEWRKAFLFFNSNGTFDNVFTDKCELRPKMDPLLA